MLDQATREAILRLHDKGHGKRRIAKTLGISRGAVREVLASGNAEVPAVLRAEKGSEHHDQILDLFVRCKGNLVHGFPYDRIRQDATIQTGAVGLITDAQQADAIIRNGQADLVLLGRAFLRNPYWAHQAANQLGHGAIIPVQYRRAWG